MSVAWSGGSWSFIFEDVWSEKFGSGPRKCMFMVGINVDD
jgi:hypothetical protein